MSEHAIIPTGQLCRSPRGYIIHRGSAADRNARTACGIEVSYDWQWTVRHTIDRKSYCDRCFPRAFIVVEGFLVNEGGGR